MRMHGANLHIFAAQPVLTALPLAGRKTVLSLSLNRATGVKAAWPVPWAPAGPARSTDFPTRSQSNLASPCEVLLELLQQSLLPSQQLGMLSAQGPQTV